jgi:hypothetical protein
VQDDAPIRQHPVDVEEHEANSRGPFFDRTLNHEP